MSYDRAKAVAFAAQQVGKPYIWGAVGPNAYDCSGLTMAAVRAGGGPELVHNAGQQATFLRKKNQLHPNTAEYRKRLQPGDLCFWYGSVANPESFGHCGLWAGRRLGIAYVIQATDDQLGIQRIRMNQYGPPTAFGYVAHT